MISIVCRYIKLLILVSVLKSDIYGNNIYQNNRVFSLVDYCYLNSNSLYLYYRHQINIHLFRILIKINTDLEQISKDTVDTGNYYKGVFYGSYYGITPMYFIHYSHIHGYSIKYFMNLNQKRAINLYYIINYDSILTYMTPSFVYLYTFYIFRYTKETFLDDYIQVCKELNLPFRYDYILEEVLSDIILDKLHNRLLERYNILLRKNPYYKIGFINRYYIYYNSVRFIDKEILRPRLDF